jgi:hypothetical protein
MGNTNVFKHVESIDDGGTNAELGLVETGLISALLCIAV